MKVFVVACALLSVAVAQTVPSGEQTILQECFEKDSISCVQQTVRISKSISSKKKQFQAIRTLKVFHSSVWNILIEIKKNTVKNHNALPALD